MKFCQMTLFQKHLEPTYAAIVSQNVQKISEYIFIAIIFVNEFHIWEDIKKSYKHYFLSCSTPFLFRCMPNFVESTAGSVFTSTGAQTIAEEIIADIELAWKEILYMCLIALGKA